MVNGWQVLLVSNASMPEGTIYHYPFTALSKQKGRPFDGQPFGLANGFLRSRCGCPCAARHCHRHHHGQGKESGVHRVEFTMYCAKLQARIGMIVAIILIKNLEHWCMDLEAAR